MTLASIAVIVGLVVLLWSADRFIEGAVSTARHFGMSPILIGMVIIGFGTSAPEMVVSALAASQGNPGIALGNAYGSNIANIALILGVTALISPIGVRSQVLRKELPVLALVTGLAAYQVWDGDVSRVDAVVLLAVFAGLMGWTIVQGIRGRADTLSAEVAHDLEAKTMPFRWGVGWLVIGLVFLVGSSRLLVWGAVEIATALGVSDLVIGLTVVAFGTSLPELASSVVAARKGEHELALGNVIGSNLFNTLAVVGIAGAIMPIEVDPQVFSRDVLAMSVLTVSLFVLGFGIGGPGRINRWEGSGLVVFYLGYTAYVVVSTVGG